MLALLTRRWAVARLALAGSWLAGATGLLAGGRARPRRWGIPDPGGPGARLDRGGCAGSTGRVVWTRTGAQLAAEEHRRRLAVTSSPRVCWNLDPPAPTPNRTPGRTAAADESATTVLLDGGCQPSAPSAP